MWAGASLLAAAQPAAVPVAVGRRVEAEQPASRDSRDRSFAQVVRSPALSGGAGLSRFFLPGSVSYTLAADRDATWYLWVRYAANQDQTLRFALPAGEASDRDRATRGTLPATGDLDTYRWGRLGAMALPAGTHRLTVFSAPVRLDCFWLGPVDRAPVDPAPADAAAAARSFLAAPLEPIVPAWLAEADAYTLPAWYEATRVCAHTRLSWPMRSRHPETWAEAGRLLHGIGFEALARHLKSGSEGAWWPSRVGAVLEEARTRDFAREIIAEAHAHGCRIFVYHRHMEDEAVAREHPGWRARDGRDRPVTRRGPMLCLNTPYADFVQTRLVELAERGADGFYFDEVHMVKPLCHCAACREGFTRATGLAYPAGDDPAEPAFARAVEYRNTVLEQVFRRWRTAIHRANPAAVLLIGSNTYPAMHDRHTTHRLWRIADAMKSEFNLPVRTGNNRVFARDRALALPAVDARLALAWTLDRDACDGRPPHVWAHGLPDATHALFATAGLLAHGQVANLDQREEEIPDPERFRAAVALGARVSPALAGSRPLRWAAVHFSEHARDHHLPDESAAWRQVLYPVYGAFTTLLRARLPVGLVTDSQLEQGRLDGYRVLFLPAPQHLTERMRAAVAAFERGGGRVVAQHPGWEWHRPDGGMAAGAAALRAELGPEADRAPVQARGGPETLHVVPYLSRDGRRLTVALVNDFSWVRTGRAEPRAAKGPAVARGPAGKAASAAKAAASRSDEGESEGIVGRVAAGPPPPCTGVRLIVRLPVASGAAREVVAEVPLRPQPIADGVAFDLPDFACLSVVTIDLPGRP
jgi:hypothetical protein